MANFENLIEAVRQYVAEHYPGLDPNEFSIKLNNGQKLKHPIGQAPRTAKNSRQNPTRHSPDFRSVHWFGTPYTFSPTQAAIVKALWEAWESGTPEVGTSALLEAADSTSERVDHLFRDHPAWGELIVTPRRGMVALQEP